MGHFITKFNLCVEQCEKCSHRRKIVWWKPNYDCHFFYCPEAQWFETCPKYKPIEKPKKKPFTGFQNL